MRAQLAPIAALALAGCAGRLVEVRDAPPAPTPLPAIVQCLAPPLPDWCPGAPR